MTKTTGQPCYKGRALPHITALYCRVSSKRQGEDERRKDRMMRSIVARAQLGKLPNGVRPTFGYQWPDVRDKQGRLTKTNQERNPTTWPIVERIWARALTGGTLHGIAVELTNDGIPTPSGLKQWDPSTIRYILTNGIYWGKPMTLRRHQVAVEPSVRAQYAHKSRAC